MRAFIKMPVPQLIQDSRALAGALLPLVVIKRMNMCSFRFLCWIKLLHHQNLEMFLVAVFSFGNLLLTKQARKTAANNMHKGGIW